MAQKLLNSDLAELIAKMKLAQQYVMTRWVQTHSRPHVMLRNNNVVVWFDSDGHNLFWSPTSLQKDYKKQMLMAAHALAVDAKNLLDVIDQSRLKMITQTPHPH